MTNLRLTALVGLFIASIGLDCYRSDIPIHSSPPIKHTQSTSEDGGQREDNTDVGIYPEHDAGVDGGIVVFDSGYNDSGMQPNNPPAISVDEGHLISLLDADGIKRNKLIVDRNTTLDDYVTVDDSDGINDIKSYFTCDADGCTELRSFYEKKFKKPGLYDGVKLKVVDRADESAEFTLDEIGVLPFEGPIDMADNSEYFFAKYQYPVSQNITYEAFLKAVKCHLDFPEWDAIEEELSNSGYALKPKDLLTFANIDNNGTLEGRMVMQLECDETNYYLEFEIGPDYLDKIQQLIEEPVKCQ